MKTNTQLLIKALRILAHDIQSDDGVANAAIAEAADRLEELERENAELRDALTFYGDCQTYGLNGGNMKRLVTDAGALARHALHKEEQP